MMSSHRGTLHNNEKECSVMTCSIVGESQKRTCKKEGKTERTRWRVPFRYSTKRSRANLRRLKSAWRTWAAASGRSRGGSFSGTRKVLLFDLNISSTDGSVFEHFTGLQTYDNGIFL